MPTPATVPVRPRLGPREWALLLCGGVVVVGLLVGILLVLSSVRGQIIEQNQRTRLLIQRADPSLARAPRVLDGAAPVLRDAAPVLKASRAAIPQARRAARETQALLEAAAPVVADLAPLVAVARPVVGQAGSLVAALTPVVADLGPAVSDLRPVLAGLRASDLPTLLDGVRRLSAAGGRTLPVLASVATEVRDRQLLRRVSHTLPTIGRIAELQRSALDASRMTLSLTQQLNGKFSESLDLQRRLLQRAEEIDRKLPGPTAP